MGSRGFSIVELVVVIGIIAILLAVGTLQFNRMTVKAAIEGQTKNMHADLMAVRAEALFRKKSRAVAIGSAFSIYSSGDTTAPPVSQKQLKQPVTAAATIVFDQRGMAVSADGGDQAVCVEPSGNAGAVDSIVVSLTRIQIGKRTTGGACAPGAIDIR